MLALEKALKELRVELRKTRSDSLQSTVRFNLPYAVHVNDKSTHVIPFDAGSDRSKSYALFMRLRGNEEE